MGCGKVCFEAGYRKNIDLHSIRNKYMNTFLFLCSGGLIYFMIRTPIIRTQKRKKNIKKDK